MRNHFQKGPNTFELYLQQTLLLVSNSIKNNLKYLLFKNKKALL